MSSKKQSDVDLKRQIKEMEQRQRQEAMKTLKVELVESGAQEPKVSFDQWWMLIQSKIKLKPHIKEIVLADFKSRGLSINESEKKYDDTLRIFGYKF